jgi:hypothetical protein
MEQFLINDLHRAFRLDALASSHPITVMVEDPEEIKTAFDAITYSKVCRNTEYFGLSVLSAFTTLIPFIFRARQLSGCCQIS